MNKLSTERQIQVVSALVEGSSIRAIERMTGIHRDTIMRLGVRTGVACQRLMDEKMRGLQCERVQMDEIWGFIGKKQRNASLEDEINGLGNAWTFVAIDADSKMVPCYKVGKRDLETANEFVADLSSRLKNRVQLSSDSLRAYVEAVELGFGGNVDYAQIVKTFATGDHTPQGRYSPPVIVGTKKKSIVGNPAERDISTSFIEKQNLTMRTHCRRLTRLTNAFSKKLENFKAAVALHFGYYNFVKIHGSIKTVPAVAGGVISAPWTVRQLIEVAEAM